MRVSLGGFGERMAKQLADHDQRDPIDNGDRGEAVPQVVNARPAPVSTELRSLPQSDVPADDSEVVPCAAVGQAFASIRDEERFRTVTAKPVPFLGINSQVRRRAVRKRQKALAQVIENLKKGDRVVTNSGLYGEIAAIDANTNTLILKIADNVKVRVAKSSIGSLDADETKGVKNEP